MKKHYKHRLFSTDHLNTDIKRKSLKGGAVTLISQALSFLIQILSTMVIARILTPNDYGIMAMVFAVTGFATILSNLGLSTATIQFSNIDQAQVSNLFWINIGIGISVAVIVATLSPFIAMFYKVPELQMIVLVLSSTFFINSVGNQHRALLSRQMQFYTLARIEILSLSCGIMLAIYLAYQGYGYWALVANSVCYSLVSTISIWFAVKWIPSLPQRGTNVRSMLKFGADVAGFNIINYFSRNLDNVLIGRYYGGTELGFYSKAYQLLMMPITNLREPMIKVAMPALSRLQNDPEQYCLYFKKYVSVLAFVSMPLIVLMFACSDQFILLLLGSQWLEASVLFKILALAAWLQPVGTSWGVVLLSTGNSKRYLRWGVISSIITCFSFLCGLPWGAKGVALAYTVVTYVLLYPSLYYGFKKSPINIIDFLNAVWKPLLASLFMGLSCVTALNLYGKSDSVVLSLLFCSVFGLFVYVCSIILISGGLQELKIYYNYGKIIFSKKK